MGHAGRQRADAGQPLGVDEGLVEAVEFGPADEGQQLPIVVRAERATVSASGNTSPLRHVSSSSRTRAGSGRVRSDKGRGKE